MSRSQSAELNKTLFQLLAELDGYGLHVDRLFTDWKTRQDVVLFGDASRSMDRLRVLAAEIPQLSAQWLMVMISHAELMHDLWRVSRGESLDVLSELHQHMVAVTAMTDMCGRLLAERGFVLH